MGDKKKKKKSGKKSKGSPGASAIAAVASKASKAAKPSKIVDAAKDHPIILAEVIAAALVATAAALKNPDKARRLAEDARDELTKLGKAGAEGGNELWQLALDIGRRAVGSISPESQPEETPAAKNE